MRRGWQILQSAMSIRSGALLDRRLGIDTGGQLAVSELGLPAGAEATSFGFGSIPVSSLRQALKGLGLAGEEYCFIDLGSGKGRALAIAAEAGFSRLIGIEHAPVLADVARHNAKSLVSIFPGLKLQILEQDAAAYIPPPTPCLIFFYTPFPGAVLHDVLTQIASSLLERKTPVVLLFARQRVDGGPQIETVLADFSCFQPVLFSWPRHVLSAYPQIDFAAYRSVNPAGLEL